LCSCSDGATHLTDNGGTSTHPPIYTSTHPHPHPHPHPAPAPSTATNTRHNHQELLSSPAPALLSPLLLPLPHPSLSAHCPLPTAHRYRPPPTHRPPLTTPLVPPLLLIIPSSSSPSLPSNPPLYDRACLVCASGFTAPRCSSQIFASPPFFSQPDPRILEPETSPSKPKLHLRLSLSRPQTFPVHV
jgi:hypothetical protein